MIDRSRIHEGMYVRSSDGKSLGRVLVCNDGTFVVEKGFFFVTEYTPSYDDVTAISGEDIQLAKPREAFAQGHRAFVREGGFGESFTFGIGGYVVPMDVMRADEERAPETPRVATRRSRIEARPRYAAGEEPGADSPTFGDEGGGGLL